MLEFRGVLHGVSLQNPPLLWLRSTSNWWLQEVHNGRPKCSHRQKLLFFMVSLLFLGCCQLIQAFLEGSRDFARFCSFLFPRERFYGWIRLCVWSKGQLFFRRGGLFEVLVSAFYGFFSTVLEMSRSEWHSSNHVPMGSENPPPHASDGGVAMSWVSERCFKRLRASQWGCETKKLGRNVGAKISSFPPSILSLNRLEKGYIWN